MASSAATDALASAAARPDAGLARRRRLHGWRMRKGEAWWWWWPVSSGRLRLVGVLCTADARCSFHSWSGARRGSQCGWVVRCTTKDADIHRGAGPVYRRMQVLPRSGGVVRSCLLSVADVRPRLPRRRSSVGRGQERSRSAPERKGRTEQNRTEQPTEHLRLQQIKWVSGRERSPCTEDAKPDAALQSIDMNGSWRSWRVRRRGVQNLSTGDDGEMQHEANHHRDNQQRRQSRKSPEYLLEGQNGGEPAQRACITRHGDRIHDTSASSHCPQLPK